MIENITFYGCGEGINIEVAEEIEIIDCNFEMGAFMPPLRLNTKGKTFRGRIINNRIMNASTPPAIMVNGMQNGDISGNIVQYYGDPDNPGSGTGLLLGGNSNGNVIRRNIFNDGKTKHAPGIEIHGSRNLIENNQITGNEGTGILFAKESSHNAFRWNMLRGNTEGPVIDYGTHNTDEGGNID